MHGAWDLVAVKSDEVGQSIGVFLKTQNGAMARTASTPTGPLRGDNSLISGDVLGSP